MKKNILGFLAVVLTAGTNCYAAELCADASAAQAVVERYLVAMQDHRFKDAFATVSSNMSDAMARDDWAGQQRMFYEGGEVNILSMDIRAGHALADDPACAAAAQVPNVLKSRDKFNNQGTTEFEIYTVRKQGDAWLVDSQEGLFDQSEVDVWFPGEKLPDFRDQY